MSDIEEETLDLAGEQQGTSTRNSHEMTNADLFSLLKTYMDNRLSGIETSFTDTTQTLEKKVKKAENSFKFKGHQVQYELNVNLQDLIMRALAYLGRNKSDKAETVLNEALNTLKKRNKLIRIADKSEGGWKTVQEYLSDDLASNSDDEKTIRAADNRAVKKIKSVKSVDKKQNVRKRSAEASGSISQTAHNAIPVSVGMPPFRGSRPGYGNQVKRSREGDMCFRCGLFGHWASGCKKDAKTGFWSSQRNFIKTSALIRTLYRLKDSNIPVRFCTNETSKTRQMLVQKLQKFGFSMSENEIFPPIPAVCQILKFRGLRPHLVVNPDSLPDFIGVSQDNPNCVVLGDATENFSYQNLNKAFQLLMSIENPVLFTLGKGKYYKEGSDLSLDVGPYAKALEYACDIEAEVVGKPSKAFFNAVLQDMGHTAESVIMIGDDIVSDVGGAQTCGMRGIQVRTGKYRPTDEDHPTVKPDGYVDNLAQAVDIILQSKT